MLTEKGLDKVRNGEIEGGFIEGRALITMKTYGKRNWFNFFSGIKVIWQLFDLETGEELSKEEFDFPFKIGDTVTMDLPRIKKEVLIESK